MPTLQRKRPLQRERPPDTGIAPADARKHMVAAQRLLKSREAKNDLIKFTEFTMPHPDDPSDPEKSQYEAKYFHKALAAALQEVEKGDIPRLIVTFPPRHGKSELSSRRLPAWILGRDPYRHIMVAAYNQPFAEDFGRDVRGIIQANAFSQVFPDCELRKGSQAADRLQTTRGGRVAFVGRGGSITGRGADFMIIDDPLKNSEEADSDTIREDCWRWFNRDVSSRMMSDKGRIIIIMTRWHEDDLVGRLTDPENPCYTEREAKKWKIINIPALAEDNDVLGREPGEPLWPEQFGVEYLEDFKSRDERGFYALYQQRPSPLDGAFFKNDMIVPYERGELPERLRIYAASDHAVTTKQANDRTCVLFGGLDDNDELWILPDIFWAREETDRVVERALSLMDKHRPITWWAESGHITKSIGPFLKRRMRERKVYVNLQESPPQGDKVQKAQAIQARMSMRMVHFPKFAYWYGDAMSELLKFPNARHDDFVDALAHLGMGLARMVSASRPKEVSSNLPRVGSLSWVKAAHNKEVRARKRTLRLRGM